MKLIFNLKLSQSLRLTPLLQQSIKLLRASQSELDQLIKDYIKEKDLDLNKEKDLKKVIIYLDGVEGASL